MIEIKNEQNNKKLSISQGNINSHPKEIFQLEEKPKTKESTFELKNYYKSYNNITDIMNEKKFNIINEIKQLNESIEKPKSSKNKIDEDEKSNSSIESLCPKDTNIYLKPYDWEKISNEINFNKIIISIMSNEEILNFKKKLEKLNLTGEDCDEKIIFNNIGSLNKYEDESEINTTSNINKESKKEERRLMWRKIKGDGNCYYRSVMFALLENIILTKNINYLKNIIINFLEKSKNKILMTMFNGLNLDINLVKKCFIMIYLSITSKSHNPILKSYIVFYKMINNFKDFDYGLILFFKFILYEYINKNKNSTFSFKFQVLLGNLLPNDCQTDEGTFNFSYFYKNYLMKFYKYAEKIIIYLTPFIFGKEIIIKYINENNGMDIDIQQYEFGKNLSYLELDKNNKIELLYKKTHYDLLYNNNYYNLYKDIFKQTLFNHINNFHQNICQICSKNNDKNSILIKLESDIAKKYKEELEINNIIIICFKCLYSEIKHNLILLYIFFIQKIKKYFLDNFSEHISDFLNKKFILSNKSIEVTYSHAINALSLYKPKYNFEYIINQIKNEICICCNANIYEKNSYNNKQLKPKIILPCKCILCSDNCIKEFFYILLSGAYLKQEFICFCNVKYNLENCLVMIEKFNENKFDCKEMIEFIFLKQNKNKCFICLEEKKEIKICYLTEQKFFLNHIIKHFICIDCFNKNENYIGQNIECSLCKRNHIIDKFDNNSKNDYVKGYNIEVKRDFNSSIKKIEKNKKENSKKDLNEDINKNKENKNETKNKSKNKNKVENLNNKINKNELHKNKTNFNDNINKFENINDDEEERVTVIKINKKKKI